MCFSANASFIAGAGLSFFGIYTLRSAKQKTILKAIPLLFGLQQICEGFVWITQADPQYAAYNSIARYGFLFFAFFLWPLLIPLACLQSAADERERSMYTFLTGAGTVVATLLAWASLTLGVTSAISCNHIEYVLAIPAALSVPGLLWYCAVTVLPFLISEKRVMKLFGMLLFASVLVSAWFYYAWFTSVWCFFSAVLSVAVYKIEQ